MKLLPLAGLGLAAALVGCAHKAEVLPEPTPQAAAASAAEPALAAAKSVKAPSHYAVRKGDSLWRIAASGEVLGDPFRWPLLYRANRDQIQDPDLIEPGQDLSFDGQVSKQDAAEAVQKAEETPPYAPHRAPRAVLPLKY